jgi:hypothetical protein
LFVAGAFAKTGIGVPIALAIHAASGFFAEMLDQKIVQKFNSWPIHNWNSNLAKKRDPAQKKSGSE